MKLFFLILKLFLYCFFCLIFTNLERDLDLLYDRPLGERDLDFDTDLSFLPFLSGDFYKRRKSTFTFITHDTITADKYCKHFYFVRVTFFGNCNETGYLQNTHAQSCSQSPRSSAGGIMGLWENAEQNQPLTGCLIINLTHSPLIEICTI